MKAVLSEDNLRDIVAGALRRHLLKEEDEVETIEQKIDRLAAGLHGEGEINVFPSARSPNVKFEFAALRGGSTFVLESPSIYTAAEGVPAQNFLGVFQKAEGGETYKTEKDVNIAMAAALVKYIRGQDLVAQMGSVTAETDTDVLIEARKDKKPGSPDAIQLEITKGKIFGAKAVYDKKTVALMVLGARQAGRKAGSGNSEIFQNYVEKEIEGILSPAGEKK